MGGGRGGVGQAPTLHRMELKQVGATLRSYVRGSGALEATAVVEGAVVTCDDRGHVTVERADAPDVEEPLDVHGVAVAPLGMELKRLPPFDVDPVSGEVTGMIGGLEHVAEGVQALMRAVGGRSVAFARFPAADGETPFALSAREGEGMVVVIGDEHFEMEEGWPPQRPTL